MNWRNRPRQSCPDGCDTILPLLSLQADGMASADESRRLEAHLSSCDNCRRAQSWMQATHLAIAQRPLVAPPSDLRARIAQAVAAQATPVVFSTRRPLVLRPAFAVAASLALAAAWVGHSLLTAHPTAPGVTPMRVSNVPHPRPAPAVGPARSVTAPPRSVARGAPAPVHHALPKPIERVAIAPAATPSRVPALEPAAPAPRTVVHPKATPHAPVVAHISTPAVTIPVKSHPVTHESKTVRMAIVPKAAPKVMTPDVTPTPPVRPDPAPTVVAVKPDEPVAPAPSPQSAPVRVARGDDALSVVRAHLTSSQGDSTPRQISRDRDARVRSASYTAGDALTPYYGMVYTPTHQDH